LNSTTKMKVRGRGMSNHQTPTDAALRRWEIETKWKVENAQAFASVNVDWSETAMAAMIRNDTDFHYEMCRRAGEGDPDARAYLLRCANNAARMPCEGEGDE
jgi:hypothetical protein